MGMTATIVSNWNPKEVLPLSFFERDTTLVARELLGKYLFHRDPEGMLAGRIVETEAYLGRDDPACHSYRGITPRCESMFGSAGRIYIYIIYGMYYCFNITTDVPEVPAAVLIRALEPVEGIEIMRKRRGKNKLRDLCNGPGKLATAMGFDKTFDGQSLLSGSVGVSPGELRPGEKIVTAPRIGISKAVDWPLRFYLADNPFVSKK